MEVGDAGDQIVLTDDTPSLWAVDLAEISVTAPGTVLTDTTSLAEASDLIRRLTGRSELDYETAKPPSATDARSMPSRSTTFQRSTSTPETPPHAERTTSACAACPNSSAPPP